MAPWIDLEGLTEGAILSSLTVDSTGPAPSCLYPGHVDALRQIATFQSQIPSLLSVGIAKLIEEWHPPLTKHLLLVKRPYHYPGNQPSK